MDKLFTIVSTIGIAYFALLVFLSTSKSHERDLFRKQINVRAVMMKFQSDQFQEKLDNSGYPVKAQSVNFIRYATALIFFLFMFLSSYVREITLSYKEVLIPILILLISSPMKYLPLGWILNRKFQQNILHKDGEIVSFLKQYQNNRLRNRGYIEFGAFCAQVAPTFEYLKDDLNELAEKSTDDGVEEAIKHFCDKFPANHHFMSNVRSILLATEGMADNNEAIEYLKKQNTAISKISSDHYQKKWTRIGDWAGIINVTPSISTFLMIVVLSLQYIMLLRGNFNGVSLFR
ncbi:hypothetical protein [Paenibacillus sp. RS8]|uniref:hypothetical protein n=1 Tax=Paenibacillus sp. RS8 TaxID=3242681 RepID=UPI0035C182D1